MRVRMKAQMRRLLLVLKFFPGFFCEGMLLHLCLFACLFPQWDYSYIVELGPKRALSETYDKLEGILLKDISNLHYL